MSESWEIIKAGFRSAHKDWREYLKIMLTTYIFGYLLMIIFVTLLAGLAYSSASSATYFLVSAIGIFIALFFWLVYLGIQIKCFRFNLLDERESSWMPFRIDWGHSFRFFGRIILLALVFLIPMIIVSLLFSGIFERLYREGFNMTDVALISIVYILLTYFLSWVMTRFLPYYVGYTIDENYGLGESWQASKPQSGLIWAFVLIIFLVFFAIYFLIGFITMMLSTLLFNIHPALELIIMTPIQIAISFYMAIVGICIASDFYRRFYLGKKKS